MRIGQLCNRLCIDIGVGRWAYLLGATCLVMGFIIEMICLGIIVIPYLRENQFAPATCRYLKSSYGASQFCQNEADNDPSNFPCLIARVNFTTLAAPKLSGEAAIYLIYAYYAAASLNSMCASRICYKDRQLNAAQVTNLNKTLFASGQSYPCYVRLEPNGVEYSAIYGRSFTEALVFHCILWPSMIFGIGLLLMWIVLCTVGCKVWTNQISY